MKVMHNAKRHVFLGNTLGVGAQWIASIGGVVGSFGSVVERYTSADGMSSLRPQITHTSRRWARFSLLCTRLVPCGSCTHVQVIAYIVKRVAEEEVRPNSG